MISLREVDVKVCLFFLTEKTNSIINTYKPIIEKSMLPDYQAVFADDLIFKGDWSEEGAKAAAEAAGYKGEEIVLVTTPDYPEMYNATLVVTQQLIEAGFNATIMESDFATFMERRADPNQFSLFITSNSYNLSPVQLSVLGSSWAGLNAPEVQEGIQNIRMAGSASESRAAWESLQEFLYEYGAACVLGHYSGVIAADADVEGFDYFNFPVYWNAKVPA